MLDIENKIIECENNIKVLEENIDSLRKKYARTNKFMDLIISNNVALRKLYRRLQYLNKKLMNKKKDIQQEIANEIHKQIEEQIILEKKEKENNERFKNYSNDRRS